MVSGKEQQEEGQENVKVTATLLYQQLNIYILIVHIVIENITHHSVIKPQLITKPSKEDVMFIIILAKIITYFFCI